MTREYQGSFEVSEKDDPRWKDREWASIRMRKIVQIAKEAHPTRFANYYALRKVSWLILAFCIGLFILHTTNQMVSATL